MSIQLENLQVVTNEKEIVGPSRGFYQRVRRERPATIGDLETAFLNLGAERKWYCVAEGAGVCADGIVMTKPHRHRLCGFYLIWKIK